MKFATELELVDYVVEKLTAQGCKSTSEDGRDSLYRGPNDTKCAAGWLIDDADYVSNMEGWQVGAVQKHWGCFQEEYMPTIKEMQLIHDCHPVEDWPAKFAELRKSCGSK